MLPHTILLRCSCNRFDSKILECLVSNSLAVGWPNCLASTGKNIFINDFRFQQNLPVGAPAGVPLAVCRGRKVEQLRNVGRCRSYRSLAESFPQELSRRTAQVIDSRQELIKWNQRGGFS